MKKTLLLLLLLLACCVTIFAQQQMGPFMAYGPETRHFANLNYSVYQSKNGYLWFGTSNGLVRFDGKRYKNFFADHANPNSPSGNVIVNFAEDKNGFLWMSAFGNGVTRYDPATNQFKKYPRLSKDGFMYYGVSNLLCDEQKELWFATSGRGLARYIYAKDSFELFYPEPDKCKDGSVRGDNYLTDICQDKIDPDILWCTSFHGLFSFHKKNKKFTYHPIENLPASYNNQIILQDAEVDTGDKLWLASYGMGLIEFNTISKKFITTKRNTLPIYINDIKKVSDSILYLACYDEGLYQYNIYDGQSENITPTKYSTASTNSGTGIQKISMTKDAGIFIGGKYYFYQQHPAFQRLLPNISYADKKDSKEKILLTGIVWDDQRQKYWLSSLYGNGIYELLRGSTVARKVVYTPTRTLLNFEAFQNVIIDNKRNVWAIRYPKGLYKYDDDASHFTNTPSLIKLPDSVIQNVTHMTSDPKGNCWFFYNDKFYYYNPITGAQEEYPLTWNKEFSGLKEKGQIFLRAGPDERVYLFTRNGIFYCDRSKKSVTHIFKTGQNKNSLASASVMAATINKYNDIWLSNGGNLQVMSTSKFSILSNHDVDHGLPSMAINDLMADSSGKIWANTSAGLAMFNPKAKYWRLYNRFDGMPKDYLDVSSFITSDNKIAIDQVNGFILKDINEVAASAQPPILRITSIRVNDSSYQSKELFEDLQQLVLPYKKNNISIEYAAMDWLYPFQTTYTFWVEGLPAFKTPTSSPDARLNLNELSAGKYIIHLKAINNSGVWSNEVVLTIIIQSPFWMKAWFIALCIIAVAGILYSIYRYRINQLKKMQAMRNNISRDLHDDIGASLSNINILNELAKRNAGDTDKTKEYLTRSEEDIQRISESLSDIVWNINPKYDDLQNLFVRMKRYAADMMDGKNIGYNMQFPDDEHKINLSMEKRRDFYLIFKEAINNMVKYSKATHTNVFVQGDKREISLTINDNGVGFNMDAKPSGNGLINMKQRAMANHAKLEIQSESGKGTTIKLVMHTT